MAGVRLVVQFTAKSPEEAEQRIKALAERSKTVQTEPGCRQFEVFRSALRPDVYALLEHWESDEALAQHYVTMGGRPQHQPGSTHERYEYQPSD
jgi:quinol monooxygenase YgiN